MGGNSVKSMGMLLPMSALFSWPGCKKLVEAWSGGMSVVKVWSMVVSSPPMAGMADASLVAASMSGMRSLVAGGKTALGGSSWEFTWYSCSSEEATAMLPLPYWKDASGL